MNKLNQVILLFLLVGSSLAGKSQVSISGPTKVDGGSTQCYSANSNCGTAGICWTTGIGTLGNTSNCVNGDLLVKQPAVKIQNGVTPLISGGSCSGASYVAIIFPTVNAITSQGLHVQDNCSATAGLGVTIVPALNNNISISPGSQTVNCNTGIGTLTASTPSGGDGTYAFAWQSSPNNSTWSTISGAAGSTYTPPATSTIGTTYYHVIVTSFDYSVTSSAASVTVVTPALSAGTISNASQAINYSTVPATINCTAASGGSCSAGTYTYQWQYSLDNVNFSSTGAAGQNYSPASLTTTTYYRRMTSFNGQNVYSNTAIVTVYPLLQTGVISPSSQYINYNTSPASLSVSGASGGNGTYTYQWQSCATIGGSYQPVGSGGSSYAPGALTTPTYYEVVTTSYGMSVTSAPVLVNVYPQLAAGMLTPASITLAAGTGPGVLTSTPATGGTCNGSYTYQWQSSTDGVNFSGISGHAGLSYNPGNISSNIYYRLQVTCGTGIVYTNICQVTIGTIATNLNYIRERILVRPGVTDTVTADGLTSPSDVQQNTQYFDGLGRPVQSVARQASPLQKDLVTMEVYDPVGREAIKYLPYTSPSNDGNYKTDAVGEQTSFNTTQFTTDQFYYGQVVFEASPLNRPLTTYAPGNSWVGTGRGVSDQYQVNWLSDSVRIWTISPAPGSIPVTTTIYPAGELYKNVTMDEAGHQVVEYKDMQGKVILKKVQLSATPGPAHVGWLNTYYIYDDLDNLRFVIQPRAVELINGAWNISSGIAAELCFRYEYDYRKRMTIKKVPGAAEVWMVYDLRDRLVMTQDSVLRSQQKWLFTRYDGQNRPDSTGLITDPSNYDNLSYHQNLASASIFYPNLSLYTTELLTKTWYDNYSWVATSGSALSATMATNYTNNANDFIISYNVSPVYAVAPVSLLITRGMMTGSMSKVVGTTSQYLYSVPFYDDRGRVIQTQSVNYTGGVDTATTQYDFSGKPLRTLLTHRKNGNTVQYHTVLTKMNYDAEFRVKSIYKKIDGAASDQLIDSMQYNELGQLRAKYLGNALDSLVYDYNIRGWLTGINEKYVGGTNTNYFGMELGYDKTASVIGTTTYLSPAFNGNIAGTIWKSAGDGVGRKYDFSYDNVNRLTGAAFLQNTSGSSWDNAKIDFTVSGLTYDANGNILSMNQNGFKVGGSAPIDQLIYTYLSSSNKLSQVTDGANDQNSKLGDFHYNPTTKGATDYSYDGNGNLVSDNNKSIDHITYNYLNLSQQVHMNGKGNITYTYDAGGNKLQKVTADSLSKHTTTTLYLDGIVYQQTDTITNPTGGIDTLQFMSHEEGRARWAFHKYLNGTTAYGWEYDFFEKDHLGNTRVLLSQEKDSALYTATMEGRFRNTENQLFYNIPATSYARNAVSGYPIDTTYGSPNDSVARLNPTGGQKIGPAIILKVMSGDKVDIGVQYYYNNITDNNSPNISSADILGSLAMGIVSLTGGAHGSFADLTTGATPLPAALTSFLGNNNPALSGKPTAYLNWILLDDQFNYVGTGGQSGALPVGAAGVQGNGKLQPQLGQTGIPITKSGYLYIYVSNATPGWDVFFDNLSVKTYSGPMVEENHYYPFGLTMAGISDKALKTNYAENKYRYNDGTELANKEFSDASGLELYETDCRSYDPQIGRFWQIDPLGDINESYSPYSFANNNPILLNDPLGLTSDSTHPQERAPVVVTQSNNHHGAELADTKGGKPNVTAGPAPEGSSKSDDTKTASQDKGDHNTVTDIAYEINKFNLLAKVTDLGYTLFTGHDSYDVKQSKTQAVTNLAATIPIGGLSSTIVNVAADIGLAEVRLGIAKTLSIENDVAHILAAKHNFGLLLPKAGSEINIIKRLYLSLGQAGGLPVSGYFQKIVNIYGYDVTIRGAVVNGIPRISTAFIP